MIGYSRSCGVSLAACGANECRCVPVDPEAEIVAQEARLDGDQASAVYAADQLEHVNPVPVPAALTAHAPDSTPCCHVCGPELCDESRHPQGA